MKRLEARLTKGPNDERVVGQLAQSDNRIYFEWDAGYIDAGVELAPFKLPIAAGLHEHRDRGFGELPGLFAESLPDGWGMLLMDQHFRRRGVDPAMLSPLDRLAYLGRRTMGALTYHPPAYDDDDGADPIDLFALGEHAEEVFAGTATEVLPELMHAGGSPGGARPKVLVAVRGEELRSGASDPPEGFEPWMIKLAAKDDVGHAGAIEQAYALMAREAGVTLPPTRLFEVKKGSRTRRYFGVRRFDRGPGARRLHVQSLANLLQIDFRIPNCDYEQLFKATSVLTHNLADVQRAYLQMVFNVAAHVRDDHTKNFSFLLDEHDDWRLTPAYDLTFAEGPRGWHTMSVAGEARSPERAHCLAAAKAAGVRPRHARAAIEAVNDAIARWSEFAEAAKCPRAEARRVGKKLRLL